MMHIFWEELKKCENDQYNGFDLKKMNHYNYAIHTDREHQLIAFISSDIEKHNLINFDKYDFDALIACEKLFLNISWKKDDPNKTIDYRTFLTQLDEYNLVNLKTHYLQILKTVYEQDQIDLIATRWIKSLRQFDHSERYFYDHQDVVINFLNSDLPDQMKKLYLRFLNTQLSDRDLFYLNDKMKRLYNELKTLK